MPGWEGPSVDVELVALRVFHRDCVVVDAFGVQDTDQLAYPSTSLRSCGKTLETFPRR